MANAARLRKSAVSAFYMYLVFLLCYLPQYCGFVVVTISDLSTGAKVFFLFSTTLVISVFNVTPCNLLLEDETHSTRCLGHTAKYISKSRLRKASVNGGREAMLADHSDNALNSWYLRT